MLELKDKTLTVRCKLNGQKTFPLWLWKANFCMLLKMLHEDLPKAS